MNPSSTLPQAATTVQNAYRDEPVGNTLEAHADDLGSHSRGQRNSGAAAVLRLVNLLALALPLGGLAFFGIFAAPAMFKIARAAGRAELAPQMVAVMLSRFGWVMIACAVAAVICWLLDSPRASHTRQARLWWRIQGAASAVILAVSLFLQFGLMPRILAMQGQVLATADPALRASFDVAHKSYSGAASVMLWACLLALGCLARRSTRE